MGVCCDTIRNAGIMVATLEDAPRPLNAPDQKGQEQRNPFLHRRMDDPELGLGLREDTRDPALASHSPVSVRVLLDVEPVSSASPLRRLVFLGYVVYMVLALLLGLGYIVAVFVLAARAAWVSVVHHNAPCDQAYLRNYVFIMWGVNQLVNLIAGLAKHRGIANMWANWREPSQFTLYRIPVLVSSVALVAWGYTMVYNSKSCSPDLFIPIRDFIYIQLVSMPLVLARSLASTNLQGSADVVRNLASVAHDAPELIDPEDGSVLQCPICLESLSSASPCHFPGEDPIVRTPCRHYFHEGCLVEWCHHGQGSCPLCKRMISELSAVGPS